MQENYLKYLKPSLIISVIVLVWFFIPGYQAGWTSIGDSGFQLMLTQGSSAIILALVPLSALGVIIGHLYEDVRLLRYAKRAMLLGVGTFLLLTIYNTMNWGFFFTVAAGCYLWWESMKRES